MKSNEKLICAYLNAFLYKEKKQNEKEKESTNNLKLYKNENER